MTHHDTTGPEDGQSLGCHRHGHVHGGDTVEGHPRHWVWSAIRLIKAVRQVV